MSYQNIPTVHFEVSVRSAINLKLYLLPEEVRPILSWQGNDHLRKSIKARSCRVEVILRTEYTLSTQRSLPTGLDSNNVPPSATSEVARFYHELWLSSKHFSFVPVARHPGWRLHDFRRTAAARLLGKSILLRNSIQHRHYHFP